MGEWQSLPDLLSEHTETVGDGRPERMSDGALVCDYPGCNKAYVGKYAPQALGRHRAHHATHKVQVGGSDSGPSDEVAKSEPLLDRVADIQPDDTPFARLMAAGHMGKDTDTEGGDMPQMDSDATDTDGHDDGQKRTRYEHGTVRLLARFYQPTRVTALAEMFAGLDVFVRPSTDGIEVVERVET